MIRELQLQIDADEIRAVCNAASDAFRTRREMLTGLGHLTREQMRSNLTVQTATQSVSSYKARRAARRGEAVDEAAE
jgi:heme oxygenase